MKTKCITSQQFHNRVKRMQNQGLNVLIETKPADLCFGQKTTASVFCGGSYASWTLCEAGGYCQKRTSVKTYAAIDGKKANITTAVQRIQNELARRSA